MDVYREEALRLFIRTLGQVQATETHSVSVVTGWSFRSLADLGFWVGVFCYPEDGGRRVVGKAPLG